MAPTSWARIYGTTRRAGNSPAAARPTVTAGLMWQPLMSPNAAMNTMTVKPCANATAGSWLAPSAVAAPAPIKISENVPMNSAVKARVGPVTLRRIARVSPGKPLARRERAFRVALRLPMRFDEPELLVDAARDLGEN